MSYAEQGPEFSSDPWVRKSDDAVHPFAVGTVCHLDLESIFFAQHARDGTPDGVALPTGAAHQLEDGRAIGVLQGCHQLGQFGASAAGLHDGLQILDIIGWRNGAGVADGGISGICELVTVANRDNPAAREQSLKRFSPCAAAQRVWKLD